MQLRPNVDYEVIIPEDIDWVEQIKSDKADELVFNVKPNDGTKNREAEITVRDKNSDLSQIFTIKQITKSIIILMESYFEIDAKGGTIEVPLLAEFDFEVIIPEDIDWVRHIETKAMEKKTFNLSVLPNSQTEEREAEITVKDVNSDVAQTLTIKQKVGKIIVANKIYMVPFKGETITIPYSSDIECNVVIPEAAQSWISVVETKSMESHSVQLSIALNEEENERTAMITIQDINSPLSQNIEIKQMPYNSYLGDISVETEEELIKIRDAGYKIIVGNVYFNVKTLTLLDNLIEEITGNLEIGSSVTSLDGLYGLKHIGGDLKSSSSGLASFEGLNNLESIGNSLKLDCTSGNLTLKPLKKLKTVGGNVILSNIDNFEWPENLSEVGDSLIVKNITSFKGQTGLHSLKSLKAIAVGSFEGLDNLTNVFGDFYCEDCHLKNNFTGLNNLQTIGGDFTLKVSKGYSLADEDYYAHFNALTSFEGLNNLQEIGGNFRIDVGGSHGVTAFKSLENFEGLENLNTVHGDFIINVEYNKNYRNIILNALSSFDGLTNLTKIGGDFRMNVNCVVAGWGGPCYILSQLQSLKGLDNLLEVNGDFMISDFYQYSSLTFSDGPKKLLLINGDFIIENGNNSSSMAGFSGLETINGDMKVRSVDSYSGLDNLKYIKGNFSITGGDTQGLANLATIGGNFSITGGDTQGLANLVTIGGNLTVSGKTSSINGLTGLNTINGNLVIRNTSMSALSGMTQLQKVGGDIKISDNNELEDISGLSGLTNCTDISITNSQMLFNFQPLETAAKNMTGTWYVYGCGYNPTKYQMLNGESKPQE